MTGRVTTYDIARAAGVSRKTVSHVLNNQPGVALNPKTRERVLAMARKFGYVGSSGHPKENSIETKDGQASCHATDHLISLGHRRIAHISYAPLVYNPSQRRFEGYRLALKPPGSASTNGFSPKEILQARVVTTP